MSVAASTWAWGQKTADKLLLLALADYADDQHQCFPSRRKLAERCMCSIDTIDRAIARLSDDGFIAAEKRISGNGRQTTNCYRLRLDSPPVEEPQIAAPEAGGGPHPAAQGEGRTLLPRERAAYRAAPTINHQKEPPEGISSVVSESLTIAGQKFSICELNRRMRDAAGSALRPDATDLEIASDALGWLSSGADFDLDVLPAIAAAAPRARPGSVGTWRYFAGAVAEAKDRRSRGLPAPSERPMSYGEAARRAVDHALANPIPLSALFGGVEP